MRPILTTKRCSAAASPRCGTRPIRFGSVRYSFFLDAEVDLSRMDWIGELIPHAKIVSVPGSTYYRTKNLALQFARGKYLVFAGWEHMRSD